LFLTGSVGGSEGKVDDGALSVCENNQARTYQFFYVIFAIAELHS
jgi:hypothetical protein